MRISALLLLVLLLCAGPPTFADEAPFCPERPGQTTPPCVIGAGQFAIETAAASWTVTNDSASRTNTFIFGDSLVRIGVTPGLEAQVGWTPVGYTRAQDKASHAVAASTELGDVKLGLLYAPGGSNGPVAFQGFVSLPTGGDPIGAKDWGAGVRVPVAIPVGEIQIALTPEVDAAVNASGSARHLVYGSAAGVGYSLTDKLQLGASIALFRDHEAPGGATTFNGGMSVAWQASGTVQLDLGGIIGLNRNSPDFQIYIGIAHLF